MAGEVWKEPKNFPQFLVSNFGRVKCKARGRLVRYHFERKRNTLMISLWKGEEQVKRGSVSLQGLVMTTFAGETPEGLVITMKDGDKRNCRLDNLEFVTKKECYRRLIERRGGHWMSGMPARWRFTAVVRFDPSTGEYLRYTSNRHAAVELNAEFMAEGGEEAVREMQTLVSAISHAKKRKGSAYGYRWMVRVPEGNRVKYSVNDKLNSIDRWGWEMGVVSDGN